MSSNPPVEGTLPSSQDAAASSLIEPAKIPVTVTILGFDGTTVGSSFGDGGVTGTFSGVNGVGVDPQFYRQ
ncbi:MAG: hypothetical protein WCD61_07790, partial [Acinetobacter bohemicus]